MTTEPSDGSAAERVEALRRRRATANATPRPSDRVNQRPARRRHPAAGARRMVVGLSASTAVALMGAMARAASPGTSTAPTIPAQPTSGKVVRPATDARTAAAPPAVADPPTVSPTTAAPVTTSQASPTP